MIVRNVSSREGSTIHCPTRSTASPHRRLVSWSRTRAPARPRSRNARRIPDTACRRRVSINPRGVRSTAVAHWSGTSMFGTPSNHSSMFRCASSHDAMRRSGVARAKINPEYGSTATNTCAFMRRPVTGSAGCGQSPVQSPDTLSPGTCSKRAAALRPFRARGEHARGTPDSHGPSAPPARRNRHTRTTTVSTAACDTRPCAPRTRRDRDADTPRRAPAAWPGTNAPRPRDRSGTPAGRNPPNTPG